VASGKETGYNTIMRKAVRAIVHKDGQLLVMKRFKLGRTYYTLLGGEVKPGEKLEDAVLREVREESGIIVDNPRLKFVEDAGDPFGIQYVYLCDFVSGGQPALEPGSDEVFWSKEGVNTYEPQWLPADKLPEVPLVSPLLQQAILAGLKHGWPKEPYH